MLQSSFNIPALSTAENFFPKFELAGFEHI